MTVEIITIGVYGFDDTGFFRALLDAGVDTFCDIRARRGVRGSAYAFANSKRLQARLAESGIRYFHFPELAPSKALREQQYKDDKANRTSKRQRTILSPAFIASYEQEQLADFDSSEFLAALGAEARVVALFCVEGEPSACHRSLLASRLQEDLGGTVTHLKPQISQP